MHWRMPRAVVSLKDGPSYVDYGGGGTTPVAPYRPQPTIYMPTATPARSALQPAPASYPGAVFTQQTVPSVNVNITQADAPKSAPLPLLQPINQVSTYQPVPTSYGVRTLPPVSYQPRPSTTPQPEPPKISMDQATSLVSQFVNGVSITHGEKYPLNIRAANELIGQVREIGKAISTPGYTVQESKGKYVVVPTSAETTVPTEEVGPAWRGVSWGRTAGSSIAVGVDPSKLPNLQRQLLNKALGLTAQLTGRPAPRLPEIKAPSSIARNQ